MNRKNNRTMRRPKSAPQTPVAVRLIAATTKNAGLRALLRSTERELGGPVESGLEIGAVSEATDRMIRGTGPDARRDLEIVAAIAEDETLAVTTREALASVAWQRAEAGFALGLALGFRLCGGR